MVTNSDVATDRNLGLALITWTLCCPPSCCRHVLWLEKRGPQVLPKCGISISFSSASQVSSFKKFVSQKSKERQTTFNSKSKKVKMDAGICDHNNRDWLPIVQRFPTRERQVPSLKSQETCLRPRQYLTIVNGGDWLGSPVNIKGTNKDAKIYVGRSTTLHNLLFYAHTLCMQYVTNTFLLVSSSVRSKQLLCFVQGQGLKTEH